MIIVLAGIAGLTVGAWLGYLLAKREEAKAKDQLADTFKALATDALRGNNETFIGQAAQAFKTVKTEAEGDLAQRQQAIEGLIKPLNEALQRYETQIANMERARQSAYASWCWSSCVVFRSCRPPLMRGATKCNQPRSY